ncbi:hypothetical protein HDU93_000381 [Gonapodya sp. JEL0774]|nr:hypothetical protein HDU93_000381 [Gonapodya sp. JEL0774]
MSTESASQLPTTVTRLPLPSLSSIPPGAVASPALLSHALQALFDQHATDPTLVPFPPGNRVIAKSLLYHVRLLERVLGLLTRCVIAEEPGAEGDVEALVLAAAGMHVRRWEVKRDEFPEGLSGYKTWRSHLAKLHANYVTSAMRSAGYGQPSLPGTEEPLDVLRSERVVVRTGELLVKKGLPALAAWREKEGTVDSHSATQGRDRSDRWTAYPAVQALEDAVCLVFLEDEAEDFAQKMMDGKAGVVAPVNPDGAIASATATTDPRTKLLIIVRKTWAKMGPMGRKVAQDEVVPGMQAVVREVVLQAVAGGVE